MKKAHSNNRSNFVHRNNEVKENLYKNSFNSVWTLREHQLKEMYTSQKIQIFFGFCQSRKTFPAPAG